MNFKQIFLTTSFLVISNFSFAQVWTLNELIKVINMNEDDADTFIIGKGYTFAKTQPHDNCKESIYGYNLSAPDRASYWFSIFTYINSYSYKRKVIWEISNLDQYSDLKKQIKTSGFIFESSDLNPTGSTTFKYYKGNYILHLEIIKVGENTSTYNQYLVSLWIKK